MLASAMIVCPRPSRPKAIPNARNSESRVRFQKRRKNSPQTKKPRATAPDRKSYSVIASLLRHVPDESPDQRGDRRKGEQQPAQPQVDPIGPHHQVQDQNQII